VSDVILTRVAAALVMAGAVALWSCGGRAEGAAPGGSRELTADEIMSVSASSLYDVIRIRRAEWLRRAATRPTAFPGRADAEVVVYLDGQRFGGPEMLKQITPASVRTARFLTPSEAEMRFGPNLLGGVIAIQSQAVAPRR
jgi:hypothetical protein